MIIGGFFIRRIPIAPHVAIVRYLIRLCLHIIGRLFIYNILPWHAVWCISFKFFQSPVTTIFLFTINPNLPCFRVPADVTLSIIGNMIFKVDIKCSSVVLLCRKSNRCKVFLDAVVLSRLRIGIAVHFHSNGIGSHTKDIIIVTP